ncbi:MAG: 16S rRNA (guanine(966)-N(2))-methyltransferase RsmD [Bacillota bacterium]|nr:16S rRNA (guanine(966)-N(2))-methyltransferase RsmD [Candidatus Fermentithermobacillaceae bacterium]
MIKVIGGEFRGRSLASVPGESTRPPLARVRAAVANILAGYIEGASVLDLFAGTGSYSIELISRGARSATCIDKNPKAVETVRRNLASLGIEDRVRLITGDATRIVDLLEKSGCRYEIILVAPPYFTELDEKTMEILGRSPLVDPAGIVVLQQHRRERMEEKWGRLSLRKTYSYGDTRISTYLPDLSDNA